MSKMAKKSKKRTRVQNPFKYSPSTRQSASGMSKIKLAGLPGYLTTAFAWLSVAGFVCFQLLSQLTTSPPDSSAATDTSPIAGLLSERYAYSPSLMTKIFSYALAVAVITFGVVATVYFFKTLVRYSATIINWIAFSISATERTYFVKIELGLLGWLLLALTMIYTGELPWVATLTAACAGVVISLSFFVEHDLLQKHKLNETNVWR